MGIHNRYPVDHLAAETIKKYSLPQEKAYEIVRQAIADMAKGIISKRSKITGSSAIFIQQIQVAQRRDDADGTIKALNELCEAEQPEQGVFDRKIHSMIAQLVR